MTTLQSLKCRFTQLVGWYVTRALYIVQASDIQAEMNKVRRYIFFMESNCADSDEFSEEILRYVRSLTALPSNCLNCPN